MASDKPRIYADFLKTLNTDGSIRRLLLTCQGTFSDLTRQGLSLVDGLEATFYMDDANEDGGYDELEADGVVRFESDSQVWVAVIDWELIRHASERRH